MHPAISSLPWAAHFASPHPLRRAVDDLGGLPEFQAQMAAVFGRLRAALDAAAAQLEQQMQAAEAEQRQAGGGAAQG